MTNGAFWLTEERTRVESLWLRCPRKNVTPADVIPADSKPGKPVRGTTCLPMGLDCRPTLSRGQAFRGNDILIRRHETS